MTGDHIDITASHINMTRGHIDITFDRYERHLRMTSGDHPQMSQMLRRSADGLVPLVSFETVDAFR
jgi:hypothetical protein